MHCLKKIGINQIEEENILKLVIKNIKFGKILKSRSIINKGNGGASAGTIIYRIMVTLFLKKSLQSLWEKENSIADCLKNGIGKNMVDARK